MSSKKKRDYRSHKQDGFKRIKDPSTKKKREKIQATDWD